MAKKRRFGKKNVIKVDPLAYNIGLIGESGIGKTTTLIEMCDELVGDEGYILFSMGKEDAVDAIAGAVYEEVPDWETFEEITEDIIENKETDYKDLKVIIYDTMDQLFDIAEPQVIAMHNRLNPDKKVKTLNPAFGGFGRGEDKVIEIILDRIWELKKVGVGMIVVGHTKRKTLTDVATGEDYDMLTTNMSNKYFSAIQTKLHILGVASIDRSIEYQKVKQFVGADKSVGKVKSESRIITFRDDNFNIDSKSRFAEIVPRIYLDSKELIKAANDAIEAEHNKQKGVKSVAETKVSQEKKKTEEIAKVIKEDKENKIDEEENELLVQEILEKLNAADKETKSKAISFAKENEISLKEHTETPTYQYKQLLSQFD